MHNVVLYLNNITTNYIPQKPQKLLINLTFCTSHVTYMQYIHVSWAGMCTCQLTVCVYRERARGWPDDTTVSWPWPGFEWTRRECEWMISSRKGVEAINWLPISPPVCHALRADLCEGILVCIQHVYTLGLCHASGRQRIWPGIDMAASIWMQRWQIIKTWNNKIIFKWAPLPHGQDQKEAVTS